MCNAEKPVGQGKTSKQNTIVQVSHQAGQCYFRTDTEEVVIIGTEAAGEFEEHWQDMLLLMDAFHQAKAEFSAAVERYGVAHSQSQPAPATSDKQMMSVTQAEQDLQKKREALQKKLGEFSLDGMKYNDVVELLPIKDTRRKEKQANGKSKAVGRRYVYVTKKYYDQNQKRFRHVSLKSADNKTGKESIYSRDSHGRVRIDTKKLGEQLKLKWPKLKAELKDVPGMEELLKATNKEGRFSGEALFGADLFRWADTWNKSLDGYNKEVTAAIDVDISAGAQFMRYATNLGASAEFNPAEGKASIQGEAKASLAVASGTAAIEVFAPSRAGWPLSLKYNNDTRLFDLGKFRVKVALQAAAFAGASVQLEAQLQVVTSPNKQQQALTGLPGGRLPSFREQATTGKVFFQQLDEEDQGLQASAEVFVGARAEAALKGSMQWLKPTPPENMRNAWGGLLKSTGDFTDFCTIGGNIAGMLGAGAGGKFHCTFINGKFCFHAAASLCWGAGAKGGFIAEVGVLNILEFQVWFAYQLYSLDYAFFEIVARDAFNAFTQYCILQIDDVTKNLYEAYGRIGAEANRISTDFMKMFNSLVSEAKGNLEASKRRNELARNTIAKKEDLLHFTPEAKGLLLYLLTRHGTWDHLDTDNRGMALLDIYPERKDAIICVLRSVQTRREWDLVLCRMTATTATAKVNRGCDMGQVKKHRQQLIDFLDEGLNRSGELIRKEQSLGMVVSQKAGAEELELIYARLKLRPTLGYALAMNDTEFYSHYQESNPHYPQRCTFGPCESEPSQLA